MALTLSVEHLCCRHHHPKGRTGQGPLSSSKQKQELIYRAAKDGADQVSLQGGGVLQKVARIGGAKWKSRKAKTMARINRSEKMARTGKSAAKDKRKGS
eukprot:jgi/Psemu1/24179/gm1.24179_g